MATWKGWNHVVLSVPLLTALGLVGACFGGGGGADHRDSTPPVITLTAPVGGELWSGTQTITWTTVEANPGTVEILLSTNSGVSYTTIIDSAAPDTGSYSWDTTTAPDRSTLRVWLTARDVAGNAGVPSASASDFTLDNTAPVTTLTSPVGGEAWAGTQDITWTTTEADPATVDILLSDNSGASYSIVIATAAADTGTYPRDTTGLADGNAYRIRVTPTDAVGNVGAPAESASDFTIDNTPPVTTLLEPVGGEVLGGAWRDIIWETIDDNLGTAEIRLSTDSGATFPTQIASGVPDTPFATFFTWDTTVYPDSTTARIRVIPTDAAGNLGAPDDSPADFALDNTPPGVVLTAPVGAETWSGPQTITWTTTDVHPGTMEIRLSTDSGATYGIVITSAAPDTGSYLWDTRLSPNGPAHRIRITATDLADNSSVPADSAADFTVVNPPVVGGYARYSDGNMNGVADAGDTLVVPFDRDIVVNGVLPADLSLLVAGDDFGVGASVAPGPLANEVTITLGAAPSLKSRQPFDPGSTQTNDPSGVDVSATMVPDAIEDATGVDAVPSVPIDIIPAFVESQSIDDAGDSVVRLGDLDGDGDLDIVGGVDGSSGNVVWLNDGTGTFSDSGQALGSSTTTSIAVGDLDSDGDLDFVAGIVLFGDEVWLNDGTGTFSDSGQALSVGNTQSVALGDLDSDGDLDFVAGEYGSGDTVWLNDGTGTFSDSGQALSPGNTESVALGDLDSDGDLDFVAGDYGFGDTVWLNDGSGNFTDSGQSLGLTETYSVALGDLDGDGDLDLVVGNYLGQPDSVWLNDGAGNFSDSLQALGSDMTSWVEIADFDSDGDLDIAAGNSFDPSRIWLNDGAGAFTDSGLALGMSDTNSVALGDLDSDGDLDLVELNRGTDYVWKNSLSGTWGTSTYADSGQALGNSGTQSVAVGDLDSDGDLDFVAGNEGTEAERVWLNDGTGTFIDSGQALGGGDTICVALGDLDSDGDLDLVVGNFGQATLVWLNDGAGNFSDSGQTLGMNDTLAVALGDVDSDGDLDFVVGNLGGPNLVWLNDGAGSFTDSGQSLGADNSASIDLGDVDLDGDLDLVEGNLGGPNLVWLNDGAGNFTDSGQSLGSDDSRSVVLGDVDRDGDLDIVTGNDFGQGNRVWINDGTGTFTDFLQALGSDDSFCVALGDVDGDGDLDIVVANAGQANQVWLNDGMGTFADSGQALGADLSTSLGLGDLDRDGDLDFVVGNYSVTLPNRVWLNE